MKETDNALLEALQARFEAHPQRHPDLAWGIVLARLQTAKEKLRSLAEMENTGGEPDVIGVDPTSGECIFCDCAPETPAGRRNLCYDAEALARRKRNKPAGSAVEAAAAMGARLLNEQEYRQLQTLGAFDTKTSSWVATPPEVRKLGGALFCDRRYGRVFTYHNGAESYYAVRGFRAILQV